MNSVINEMRKWREEVDLKIKVLNLIQSVSDDVKIINPHYSVTLSQNPDWFNGGATAIFEQFREGVIHGEIDEIVLSGKTASLAYLGRQYEITLITSIAPHSGKTDDYGNHHKARGSDGKFQKGDSRS